MKYTVQCGYHTHYGNVVEVEADTLDGALAKAVEEAGMSDAWKSTDACGDTYVDAVCEGGEERLWADDNPFAVPDEFKDDADQLAAALLSATKSLIAERDCLYQSVATSDGTIWDADDQRQVSEADAEIDAYRAVLKRCGYLGDGATGRTT